MVSIRSVADPGGLMWPWPLNRFGNRVLLPQAKKIMIVKE